MKPSELEYKGRDVKPAPLIFEPQHRNIVTLIAVMSTILIGMGIGWAAGGLVTGWRNASPVNQGSAVTQASHVAPFSGATAASNEDDKSEPNMDSKQSDEPEADKSEGRDRDDRHVAQSRSQYHDDGRSARRSARYAKARGEPIPVQIIKGKPIRKAVKKMKFW